MSVKDLCELSKAFRLDMAEKQKEWDADRSRLQSKIEAMLAWGESQRRVVEELEKELATVRAHRSVLVARALKCPNCSDPV